MASAVATVIAAVTAVWVDTREAGGQVRYQCGDERLTEPEIARKFGVTVDKLHRAHSNASVTNEILCTMKPEHLAKAFRKADTPKPDHPGEAVEFRNMFYRDEDGTIPERGLIDAKEQLDQLMATPGMVAPAAGITSGSWTALGPGNIGGRVRAIIINPSNAAHMLIGSVSGGIWRTTNSGGSWTPVNDFLANLAVSTLAATPASFNTQYAGTGEGYYNADGIRGAGIFKSTDGGVTWSALASTSGVNFQYVNRIAISSNSATVVAATRTGIFRSTDGGATWPAATLAAPGAQNGVTDVDFNPTDPNRGVAGGFAANAWYTTDGGASWILAAGLPGGGTFNRVETAFAASSPNIVYASVDAATGASLIYRSTDFGANYALMTGAGQPDYLSGQGWYDNTLFVDPTNPAFLIVGGVDLYKSTDSGATFTRISRWDNWPASAHADHHIVVPVPGFNGTSVTGAVFGNDGGIYTTGNIYTVGNNPTAYTFGWQELNNGLAITQFYGAGAHDATGKVMGGTQDNGTLTYTTATGYEGWVFEFGGDGGWSAIDQTDPTHCYGEYVYLQIHRSNTGCGAATGAYIYTGIGDAGNSSASNFISPFILDPNDQSRLLAGGRSLWRTSNAKALPPVWASIKAAHATSNISAIAVQQGDANHVWVGHNNGDVFKTTNGLAVTPTWNLMDTGLPNRLSTRIAIDKNNNQIIYATFGGYAADNIWKSINGGTSWTNIHGSIPAAPVRSIAINPNNSNWLYVGTEVGIFASENGGATWTIPQEGPANVSVDEVFFSGGTLYAATHGRGIFKTNLGAVLPGKVTQISPNSYTNDTTPTYRWNSDPNATFYQLWVNDTVSTKIAQWYTEAEVGCAAGGVCQITPAVALVVGNATWWVQTWNPTGYGPWSDGMNFHTGLPTAQVISTFPLADVQPGYSAPLWVRVQNTGGFALPSGSQAWIWVTGPGGFSGYVGYVDVSGLAAGAAQWYLFNWDVPVGRTPGVHTYWGIVWSSPFGAFLSGWSAGQNFNVLATPTTAARIVSTYDVYGAVRGGSAQTWALVRNIGSTPLTGRVWFFVYNVGWTGYADISALASGAEQWYSAVWSIPAAEPLGTHWYLAQVWNTASTVALSPASPWQPFTVGFSAPFTTGFDGFAPVTGTWVHQSGTYLFTDGVVNQNSTLQYPGSFTNIDYQARVWRNGDDGWYHGIYIRGTPTASFWSNGYMLLIARAGQFSVWKTVAGAHTAIQNWTVSGSIATGSAWNTVRLIATGNNLYAYINGTLVWSGTDSQFSSGQVGIQAYRSNTAADAGFGFWTDFAILSGYGAPVPNREGETTAPPAVVTDKVSPEQDALNKEANRNSSGQVYDTIPPPPDVAPRRPGGN